MLILYVPNFELATNTMSQVSENKTLEATPITFLLKFPSPV